MKNHNGTFWTVRFNTGEYGNRFKTEREARQYADAANRYSQSKRGEYVVREIVRFVEYHETIAAPAHN